MINLHEIYFWTAVLLYLEIVGSPVTLRKHKEHILWSEKLTVNIVRKNMHQMGTQDTKNPR